MDSLNISNKISTKIQASQNPINSSTTASVLIFFSLFQVGKVALLNGYHMGLCHDKNSLSLTKFYILSHLLDPDNWAALFIFTLPALRKNPSKLA